MARTILSVPIDKIFLSLIRIKSGPQFMDGIDELAASMSKVGLLSPIMITTNQNIDDQVDFTAEFVIGDVKFTLVHGERRLLAAKKLGWTTIDAVLCES